MSRRVTRGRLKERIDELRKEIAGWSISKYLESPTGVSTGAPPLPQTRVSRSRFRERKDKVEMKEGGWSTARSKESEE